MKNVFALLFLFLQTCSMNAQRFMDRLDRGLVATVTQRGPGNFVSWRKLGEEYFDVTYNLYSNGTKIASGLNVTNYVDTKGDENTRYQVAPVIKGVEGEKCPAITRWKDYEFYNLTGNNTGYLDIPGLPCLDRNGVEIPADDYGFNDCSVADVDGDGQLEIIAMRCINADTRDVKNTTRYNRIECYELSGERLWSLDVGPNMQTGPDGQWDAIAYDWDMDGKAEIIMRGANNMRMYKKDGTYTDIGDMSFDSRVTYNSEYTFVGDEYLLYINGATGELFPIGPNGEKWMDYPLPRLEKDETDAASVWGDGTGHRGTKHYFGAPYVDGHKPSIFLGRGCYTRHKFTVLDVDPATHKLSVRWRLNQYEPGPWFGQGYHNFAIADVDMDGRDEIMFGSMTIDDNGFGLSTVDLGHGDAQHCSDLDPYRWGLEQFACNESNPAMNYRNATTSQVYYRKRGTGDDGRAMAGNFYNEYPGCQGQSSQTTAISLVADKMIPNVWVGDLAFRIYWDGDLCEEILNSPGTNKNPKVDKPGVGRIFMGGGNMNNGSKNNPGCTADLIGDWREEIVVRCGNGLRIFTSNYPSDYGITTLLHDHQYRNAMLWQTIGYNQPPHCSFFLGELEGITNCPPALTNTGRTLIGNKGTISSANNGQQVLMNENNDTEITIVDGAEPWVAIFNIPSWVQGSAPNNTTVKEHPITYTYYTCTVNGGGFAGETRLVKQGEGELKLPNVEMKHKGNTDVWNGILSFDGKMLNSLLWLNRHTTLKSNGGTFRSVKADYNSTILPGGAENIGSVTTDSLILGFGSRVVIDIDADGVCDKINTKKQLVVETKTWEYGPKYLAPVMEIATNEVKIGRYDLGILGGVSGLLDDIIIEGLGSQYKTQLVAENEHLWLEISEMRSKADIVWNGNQSSVWNLARTENFTLVDTPESDGVYFATGDNVLFDGHDGQKEILLKGQLEPSSVVVDSERDYVFKGNGAITGDTRLIKRGNGTLSIYNDNSFTGGTQISGGTVSVEVLSNTNMKLGALGAMHTDSTDFVIENGATLRTTIDVTMDSPILLRSDEGGVIENEQSFMMSSTFSGAKLTKRGDGWMTLYKDNLCLDTLCIEDGVLINDWVKTPAKVVVMNGGSINDGPGTSYPIIVPEGKKAQWNPADGFVFSNKIRGNGELKIFYPIREGNGWTVTRTPIAIDLREFEGTIVADSRQGDGRFAFSTSYGIPNGTIEILSHVVLQNEGKTMRIGRLAGTGSLGGYSSFSNNGAYIAPTWQVGNDENWSWSGKITDFAHFVKVGSGKMTLSGKDNDYTGNTTVSEGELHFNSGVSLGTGKLIVNEGATLSGSTGNTSALSNSSVTINGTLQVGLTPTITSGVINFGQKSVTFGQNSTLVLGIAKPAAGSNTGGASIQDILRLTMNGTVHLNVKENVNWQVGDSIVLWKAKICIGKPALDNYVVDAEKGLYWDDSQLRNGVLKVTDVVPTGIMEIVTDEEASCISEIYDLSGRKLSTESIPSLKKGVYIIRKGKQTHKIYIK
ncbi:MAG: autotransporter-associated beta strand repeat-containing protein [Bacteroides sp.]|nr:autotransporter-associated beta strand repeat-containing protein [Roseburia sp.]MCM1346234.1 autotransporter-associated beta strand repeat-containing protein [Bacteroides sp.]MCM1421112.1 autotransporter-associated beta strand repeat-containing protein [Bacteroides sp.]